MPIWKFQSAEFEVQYYFTDSDGYAFENDEYIWTQEVLPAGVVAGHFRLKLRVDEVLLEGITWHMTAGHLVLKIDIPAPAFSGITWHRTAGHLAVKVLAQNPPAYEIIGDHIRINVSVPSPKFVGMPWKKTANHLRLQLRPQGIQDGSNYLYFSHLSLGPLDGYVWVDWRYSWAEYEFISTTGYSFEQSRAGLSGYVKPTVQNYLPAPEVQKLSDNPHEIWTVNAFSDEFSSGNDICCDAAGNVYVMRSGRTRLSKINADGSAGWNVLPGYNIYGIAVPPDGSYLYAFLGSIGIAKINPATGAQITTGGWPLDVGFGGGGALGGSQITQMMCDNKGFLYVVRNHSGITAESGWVHKINPATASIEWSHQTDAEDINPINQIDVNDFGVVAIASLVGGTNAVMGVHVLEPDGSLRYSRLGWDDAQPLVESIVIDNNDFVYAVPSAISHALAIINKFSPDGGTRWKISVENRLYTVQPTPARDGIYCQLGTTVGGEFCKMDLSGSVVWRMPLKTEYISYYCVQPAIFQTNTITVAADKPGCSIDGGWLGEITGALEVERGTWPYFEITLADGFGLRAGSDFAGAVADYTFDPIFDDTEIDFYRMITAGHLALRLNIPLPVIPGLGADISVEFPPVEIYKCFVTGTPDLEVPISTFQSRLRSGTPSYLQVTVPNAAAYIDDIQARTSGEIVVRKYLRRDVGLTNSTELARVAFDSLAYDRGANNWTITMSGNKTTTNTATKTVALSSVSGVSLQADGKRRARGGVDFYARPGDTVTWDGNTMTAGLITITVGRGTAYMDITEA